MSRRTRRLAGLAALLPLLYWASAGAAAPALGRLFATPAERGELDARRAAGPADAAGAQPAAVDPTHGAPAAAEAPPDDMVLDGVLRRSSGGNTVWINQVARDERRAPPGRAAVQLQLPSGRRVLLRPGQRYEQGSGTVKDLNQP